ncbi:MAG: hypothetical protein ACRC78_13155, partial [Planktothrix sp.]
EIRVIRGEHKRVVLPMRVNNANFDVSDATQIVARLEIGGGIFNYSLTPIAGYGTLTNSLSVVGFPAVPETILAHEIALYLEAAETALFPLGGINAQITITKPNPQFPSNEAVEIICIPFGRVLPPC